MLKGLMLSLAAAALPGTAGAVTYSFTTDEPFAGGVVSFTYETPSFVGDTAFIDRSALGSASANVQRIRFEASCPFGGGAGACDQLTIVAGSSIIYRYFANGAFSTPATYTGANATSLTVSAGTAAVPGPSAWAMLVIGAGAVGVALRQRRPAVSAALAT